VAVDHTYHPLPTMMGDEGMSMEAMTLCGIVAVCFGLQVPNSTPTCLSLLRSRCGLLSVDAPLCRYHFPQWL
jgi:hypothetical protein